MQAILVVHAIEVALESVDVHRPEAAELLKPGVHFFERFGPHTVKPPLGVDTRIHKSCLAQHAQMLGDRRLRHPQGVLDLSD